jgi:TRAP-type mannitol/chloroaromatic compound transport system permease small subunit
MNLPVWPFRVIFLAAFALLTLQIVVEVIKAVRRLKTQAAH